VIVVAYGEEPVRLVEIERSEKLVYVAAELLLDRVASGDSQPVGVPKEDVYPFDAEIFERARKCWESGEHHKVRSCLG
jgi:hypothetical protein